ncbi:MAG: 4Fe-4S binding protein [Phycisphaerales bacterium]|nr:4Fe-4S binding protein [Phycisphaerales bacterium]
MSCPSKREGRSPIPDVSLTVLRTTGAGATDKSPHSHMGWKRAVILGIVQLLIIVHIVQYAMSGETIAPLEPSEGMKTMKDGIVTAGFLLFAVALISTAILGRWFCGWGCHVVMLQDLCGWIMKKFGVRPHAFRSRLLLYLPLGLAIYMFLWPLFYRLAIAPWTMPELATPALSFELTVTNFWATFPGVIMAVPFLLVCGFLTVYMLGSKGYCTYACPYGGFFAPLDEIAPMRIRVTDACDQCGHCTAVCTSNVEVHREVHDFGMVVNQGCMKCMDCVSACPKDALYFGLGMPAFLAKPRVEPKPSARWDLSMREEVALSLVALIAFFSVRGTISLPLLFAAGVAAIAAFIAWKSWEMLKTPAVRFHRFQLKLAGRLRSSGWVFAGITAFVFAGFLYVGAINAAVLLANRASEGVVTPAEVVFSGSPVTPNTQERAAAERAIALYSYALPAPVGIGFNGPWILSVESRIAYLRCVLGDYEGAEAMLRAAGERDGWSEAIATGVGQTLKGRGRLDLASAWGAEQCAVHPEWDGFADSASVWLRDEGRTAEAILLIRKAVTQHPDSLALLRRLSLLLCESGDAALRNEGIAVIDFTLEIAPDNAFAYVARGRAFRDAQDFTRAEADLRKAAELAPQSSMVLDTLGQFLMSIDKVREAAGILKQAGELRLKGA